MTSEVMAVPTWRVYCRRMSTSGVEVEGPTVGALLRQWRERRRLSQLQLSSRAEVSTRHLSYIETGRSRPTPEMIVRLAEHLEVPLRARNELLLTGGYAPRYRSRPPEDASLAAVMTGLRGLLDAHLPSPALLLDEQWDIVDANSAVDLLLAGCDAELLEPPVNAVRIALHPRGLAPRIRNLAQWAGHLHQQVSHRAEQTRDPALLALAREIRTLVALPAGTPPGPEPVLVLELEAGASVLRFFTVAARLETARDTTLEGLHLETFLPADARTAEALRAAGS